MNFKVLLLCLLGLTSSTGLSSGSKDITKEEWIYLCSSLRDLGYEKVNCSKIDKPLLVFTKAVQALAPKGWELYGVTYDGEPYILINPTLDPAWSRTIVVHETVHYVLWQFYGPTIQECESEKVARIIHHKWERTNYEEDDWARSYGC